MVITAYQQSQFWKSDNLILSLREFHKLGPKYLIDLRPYDVVLYLGRDKIRDPLRSYDVARKKKRSLMYDGATPFSAL